MLKDDITRQLDNGNVVLLSNLGFTAAGEVLNCHTYDVGLHAAVEVSRNIMHSGMIARYGRRSTGNVGLHAAVEISRHVLRRGQRGCMAKDVQAMQANMHAIYLKASSGCELGRGHIM